MNEKIDLVKMLAQTYAVRKDSGKENTMTNLTPMARKIWKQLRKNIQEQNPGIKVSLSLFLETMIYLCKRIVKE